MAYQNYMSCNKQFVFACILKNCNEEIVALLVENSYLLPDKLISDSMKLISHYDIWIQKWRELATIQNPTMTDEFVFENTFSFPKDAAKNLQEAYLAIKNRD